jgi:amino acid permease
VLALTITVSADDPILPLNSAVSAAQNPPFYPGGFVVMALRAGIPQLASFINFVMLVAAASTAAADVYMVVRPAILYFQYTDGRAVVCKRCQMNHFCPAVGSRDSGTFSLVPSAVIPPQLHP